MVSMLRLFDNVPQQGRSWLMQPIMLMSSSVVRLVPAEVWVVLRKASKECFGELVQRLRAKYLPHRHMRRSRE